MNHPESGNVVLDIPNTDPDNWVADEFNRYHNTFVVTDQMMNSTSVYMSIKGPRPGADIIFDQVSMTLYEGDDLDCNKLIVNGQFETSNMEDWDVHDNGKLSPFNEGHGASFNSLITSERMATSDGPATLVNHLCMVEGRQYVLTAFLKLYDEEMNPFQCDKTAGYGDPAACPILEIEMIHPTGFYQTHPENTVTDPWVKDDWNEYRAVFTVSKELANAEKAYVKFKGPFPGISIVLDDIQASFYEVPVVNCNQLIMETNAENGLTTGWKANGGGYIEVVPDGDGGSSKAFGHFGRNYFWAGPKQFIETSCLVEGDVYEINARFKLLDLVGNPTACDKTAPWKDENYCLLMTFEMELPAGNKRIHAGNMYGQPWIADEFNSFHTRITVTKDMVDASSNFFFFQGPRAGITILFDNISMKSRTVVS